MSDSRRIFGGFYKRYDGKFFVVVTTATDYETGEETVILSPHTYSRNTQYMTIPKKDFCKKVIFKGKTVNMFARQTQMAIPDWQWGMIKSDGFKNVQRGKNGTDDFEKDYDESFFFARSAPTYPDYAKALCKKYSEDKRKVAMCIKAKKCIGISKAKFNMLYEDCKFIDNIFNTVLSDYKNFFSERYIKGLSVRKYAEVHGKNKGSVEHTERKMITILAVELRKRDEADGETRIKIDSDF